MYNRRNLYDYNCYERWQYLRHLSSHLEAMAKKESPPLWFPYTCFRKHHAPMLPHTWTRSKGHALAIFH